MANFGHKPNKSLANRIVPGIITTLLIGGVGYHAVGFNSAAASPQANVSQQTRSSQQALPTIPAAQDVQYEDSTAEVCSAFTRLNINCAITFVNNTAPVGRLLSQSPEAGRVGNQVRVVYSKGPARVVVPILSGLSRADALERLWASGLTLGNSNRVDAAAEPGTVVNASRKPSEFAPNGTAIDVTYSTGRIPVPNWKGKTKELVQAEASQLGVRVVFEEQDSDSPAGVVLSQDSPGARVPFLQPITVVVSKASEEQVEVPDVVGMSQEQAIALLASAGFLKITTVAQGSSENAVVSSTTPEAGSTAAAGDEITIAVAPPQ